MTIKYLNNFLGIGCVFLSACSTLSDYGVPDVSSFQSGLPSTPDTNLAKSRFDSVTGLAKAATLSNEEVIAVAKSFAEYQDHTKKVAAATNPYSVRLNNLVKNHKTEDGLKLNYKVYLDPQVNAFAMADGTVRVYSGLMDMMKDDELLSVIGHEIGHVKLQHAKSQIQKANVANSLLSAGSGELQAGMGGTIGGQVKQVGIAQGTSVLKSLAEAQFSQSDEEDADDYGLNFLKKHGYRKDAGVSALKKLAGLESGKKTAVGALFSSHPGSEDRAERLQEELGEKSEEKTVIASSKAGEPEVEREIAPAVESVKSTWFIQVQAATDKESAEKTLTAIKNKGHRAEIQEAFVNDVLYLRVLVGPFESSNAAKALIPTIENYGISDGQPFLKKSE
jgi:putative metalloprotease